MISWRRRTWQTRCTRNPGSNLWDFGATHSRNRRAGSCNRPIKIVDSLLNARGAPIEIFHSRLKVRGALTVAHTCSTWSDVGRERRTRSETVSTQNEKAAYARASHSRLRGSSGSGRAPPCRRTRAGRRASSGCTPSRVPPPSRQGRPQNASNQGYSPPPPSSLSFIPYHP